MSTGESARTALIVAVITQLVWGLLPLWAALYAHTASIQLLVWRIFFCALTATIAVFVVNQHQALLALLRAPRRWLPYACASLMLALNWFGFFWAVEVHRVLEISLATFLMPLLSIAMGVVFLRD